MVHFPEKTIDVKQAGILVLFLFSLTILSTGCTQQEIQEERDDAPFLSFTVLDTDFSKGRLGHKQEIILEDLVRLHGHLCDGLIEGARALEYGLYQLYTDSIIDRTATRIVSRSSPCLADAALLLSGARYQYGSFWVNDDISGLYVVGLLDSHEAYIIRRKDGVKPPLIDELGELAIRGQLSACGLDSLRRLEEAYGRFLQDAKDLDQLFEVEKVGDFNWNIPLKNDYIKTDILNKDLPNCLSKE